MATTPINSSEHAEQRLAAFYQRYPVTRTLKIQPVGWGDRGANGGLHDGFDIDDVQSALGPVRFKLLTSGLKQVFCCGHRNWPTSHADPNKAGAEVHCIYASDLERFLELPTPDKGGH